MADNSKILVPVKNIAPVVYVPQATTTYKGIIQVGDTLQINNDGVLNIDPSIPADITALEGRVNTAEGDILTIQNELGNVGAVLDIINGEVI